MTKPSNIRRRRETCWWEPIYDPPVVHAIKDAKWSEVTEQVIQRRKLNGEDLSEFVSSGNRPVFKEITFEECDFQGFFKENSQIVFDNCKFLRCDFSLSTWENTKFSICGFSQSSFGQAVFKDSEFRSCKWKDLAISQNGTRLDSTYISNSGQLIASAWTNLDPSVLLEKDARKEKQIYKLEEAKATLSRRILKILQEEGDETAFYDAVKTAQLQHTDFRMNESLYKFNTTDDRKFLKYLNLATCLAWKIEKKLLIIFGYINNWGSSVTKPITFSFLNMILFCTLYSFMSTSLDKSAPQRAFDISILAGYTNYGNETFRMISFAQNLHIAISIVLYSVAFATILNRLSRVR